MHKKRGLFLKGCMQEASQTSSKKKTHYAHRWGASEFAHTATLENTIGGAGSARYRKAAIHWRDRLLTEAVAHLEGWLAMESAPAQPPAQVCLSGAASVCAFEECSAVEACAPAQAPAQLCLSGVYISVCVCGLSVCITSCAPHGCGLAVHIWSREELHTNTPTLTPAPQVHCINVVVPTYRLGIEGLTQITRLKVRRSCSNFEARSTAGFAYLLQERDI